MRQRIAGLALTALLTAPLGAAPQHSRLFPPDQLGTLEGPDRDAWNRPDQIMDRLLIADGSAVADLGAGGGWFTMRLATRVGPNGTVYAEDVQSQMIDAITRRTARAGLRNVRTVLGTASDPRLPAPVDAVLFNDSYHEVEHPVVMLGNAAKALKPNGRIGIVEFRKDGFGPGPPMEERVDPEQVIRDAQAAGLRLVSRENFPRYLYMLVFSRQ
jgi:ubiquinone/menaquinone biosynthesis C-methylase UbiE